MLTSKIITDLKYNVAFIKDKNKIETTLSQYFYVDLVLPVISNEDHTWVGGANNSLNLIDLAKPKVCLYLSLKSINFDKLMPYSKKTIKTFS